MPAVKVYNWKGETIGDIELSDAVFAVSSNDTLLHQVFVAQANNRRDAIAHTKDRSERAGSGKKPWKQKGTGRARAGSAQSPLWRKGGVTFGPTKDRNFSQKTTQKMRRRAVSIALSEKIRSGKVLVVNAFDFESKKTKLFAAGIQALNVNGKSLLVGLTREEKPFELMIRNVQRVQGIDADILSVYDILNREYLLITQDGIRQLEARLNRDKK